MVSDARGLPADLSAVEPLWELKIGSHQYSIPTIVGDKMVIGVNDAALDRPGLRSTGGGVLMLIDRTTGGKIWQFVTPRFVAGNDPPYHYNKWKSGFCSGPVVDGDRIYIVGGRGEVLCLDLRGQADGNDGPFTDEIGYMEEARAEGAKLKLEPTDGDIIWNYSFLNPAIDVVCHDVCGSTLLMHGDFLYACTSNGIGPKHKVVPHPLAPSVIVLNKKTGELVAVDGEEIGTRMLHGHWSSPILARANGEPLIIFGGGDGVLYAFEPVGAVSKAPKGSKVRTLKKVWSHDCNPPDYRVRDGKPVLYSRWNKKSPEGPSEIIGSPVFHKGRIYVVIGQSPLHGAGRGYLSCVDAATGDEVWGSRLVDRSLATPSVADGLLYVSDFSGKTHCFDAETGERYWEHTLGDKGAWSASAFVADGKVYASSESNIFWVFEAGKEKKVLSRTRFSTMPITPAAADGVLYVPTQNKLIAYPGRSTARP